MTPSNMHTGSAARGFRRAFLLQPVGGLPTTRARRRPADWIRSLRMTRTTPMLQMGTPRRHRSFSPQAEGLEGRQLLNAGGLDTSFGTGGYLLAGPAEANAVQIDSSGNILAAGGTGGTLSSFRVVRMTPTGAVDPSFGSNGSVTTPFAGQYDMANAMAIQSNGLIVVAGTATNLDPVTTPKSGKTVYYQDRDFALARYNTNGSLDTSFGNGGTVTTNIGTYTGNGTIHYKEDDAYGVAIQDDGKIVVGGTSFTSTGATEGVLVRYNTDGSLDKTFGSAGTGVIQITLPHFTGDGVWGLSILRDPTNPANDKVVTMEAPYALDPSGHNHWSVAVARYNLDGSPDATFGTGGRTVTTMPGQIEAWGMALQSDGSVVVGGYYIDPNVSNYPLALFRYTPAGVLDPTFGNNGVALDYDPTGTSDYGYAVAVQPADGDILLAGVAYTSTTASSIVARFTPAGAIDTTFGTNGIARNAFTNAGSVFRGVTVQPNGNIVAVGGASTTINKSTTSSFLIARFQGTTATPLMTAAAHPRTPANVLSPAPMTHDIPALVPLVPPNDQDLTLLATEQLRTGTKRSRTSPWR
jgi:uncharacterized delta-60 repeat protein